MMRNDGKTTIAIKADLVQTTACDKQHQCLAGEGAHCRVEKCVGNEIHFVKCLQSHYCKYVIDFGDSYLCSCPVRKEIFNKYNI